jgi:hypothetical protein
MEEDCEENSSEWLLTTLREVQLDQFYVRIRDHLQISRISHFEYVTPEDLEKVSTTLTKTIKTDFFYSNHNHKQKRDTDNTTSFLVIF